MIKCKCIESDIMSKVFIKECNDLESINIDDTNINIKRKEYLNKLKGHNKIMSYLAWCYLKEIVSKEYNLDIDKLNLFYNEFGKPMFKEFCFNISHSENIIAIAISQKEIGVDIQLIKKDTSLLAKKMNIENNNEEVIKRFSAIEAYYKKIGTGINYSSLKEIKNCYQKVITINDKQYVLSVDSEEKIV